MSHVTAPSRGYMCSVGLCLEPSLPFCAGSDPFFLLTVCGLDVSIYTGPFSILFSCSLVEMFPFSLVQFACCIHKRPSNN